MKVLPQFAGEDCDLMDHPVKLGRRQQVHRGGGLEDHQFAPLLVGSQGQTPIDQFLISEAHHPGQVHSFAQGANLGLDHDGNGWILA